MIGSLGIYKPYKRPKINNWVSLGFFTSVIGVKTYKPYKWPKMNRWLSLGLYITLLIGLLLFHSIYNDRLETPTLKTSTNKKPNVEGSKNRCENRDLLQLWMSNSNWGCARFFWSVIFSNGKTNIRGPVYQPEYRWGFIHETNELKVLNL